jgi:hypothetical protein
MSRVTITTDHIITDHGITTGTAIVAGITGTTGIIGIDLTNVSDDSKLRLTLQASAAGRSQKPISANDR